MAAIKRKNYIDRWEVTRTTLILPGKEPKLSSRFTKPLPSHHDSTPQI